MALAKLCFDEILITKMGPSNFDYAYSKTLKSKNLLSVKMNSIDLYYLCIIK